jgi:CheY-like chemotaxis protein
MTPKCSAFSWPTFSRPADENFQIIAASSGEQGLQLARSMRPDLVLLDYSLADMTGDKICAALLENQVTARIPVLMMSGHVTELTRTAETYPNVVAALPKPFLSGTLINEVTKALAAGPLPPPPPPSPAPEKSPSPLPNGHEPTGDGATAWNTPAEGAPSLPSPILSLPGPVETSKPPSPAPEAKETTAPVVRRTEMNITFAFDVVALELTPALEIATARLEPITRLVAAQLEDDLTLEVGFRLGALETTRHGGIESLRLIPTQQPIPLAAVAILSPSAESPSCLRIITSKSRRPGNARCRCN